MANAKSDDFKFYDIHKIHSRVNYLRAAHLFYKKISKLNLSSDEEKYLLVKFSKENNLCFNILNNYVMGLKINAKTEHKKSLNKLLRFYRLKKFFLIKRLL
jgi:GTP1/Obg family GTP-binding protein